MRIYIDSGDLNDIKAALATGFVYGVTTNPTLLRRANVRVSGVAELVRQAFSMGAKEMHLQTYAADAQGIVREGTKLAALNPGRIVVKIPAVAAGYEAAAQLTAQGLRVTMTAVYTVRQVMLADCAGAHYVAVYLGRMGDAGMDALDLVGRMQRTIAVQGSKLEILAASVRTPEEIDALGELGVATATLPLKVLARLVDSDATAAAAATFFDDAGAIA